MSSAPSARRSSTPESTACEASMCTRHPLLDTCDLIIRERTPNLFRLYLNPFVVQTCLCLSRYVQDAWHRGAADKPEYQSFLANGFDEALSGAIKLARYAADVEARPTSGLVIDPAARLGSFASLAIPGHGKIEFVPNLVVVGTEDGEARDLSPSGDRFGFVVLFLSAELDSYRHLDALLSLVQQQIPFLIVCADRTSLARLRQAPGTVWEKLTPDIVVFDESFVHKHVPFGAFTARRTLYDYWNTPGNSTFHSTTYQPNSISSLHFLRCVENDDPEFYAGLSTQLESVRSDPVVCKTLLGELYSPFLCKTIAVSGLDTPNVQATGHYVVANGRRIFDGVGGVACSVRGHNPESYVPELVALDHVQDYHQAVATRLECLTGLECLLPAVSGASAVENALRIGLAAQSPRKYVLALQGGFGGKTLLALTGTAKASYKKHLGALYEQVLYIDPFGDRALEEIDGVLGQVGSSRVDLQACKLEYSIVSPK